jgi:hypothetical protein
MNNFNITKIFIQIITNILLISLFLAVFYFTYAKNEENAIFSNNIKYLSDDLAETIKLAGPDVYTIIKQKINTVTLPDLSHEDNNTNTKNNNILKNAIIANVVFLIVVILLVLFAYLRSDKSFNLSTIIIQNLIILFFVGLTEYCLLTYFFSEYISVDPNSVKLAVVSKFN